MKTGAVIAAAGMSVRMGDFKQLMKIGGMTMAERVVTNFRRAGIKDIVMVTGCRAEQVEKTLYHMGITFLRNENYETTEMFDSAKIGLTYLRDRCDRVFFCPADVPFFTEETMQKLLERQGDLVIPAYKGRQGHPVRMDASLIPSILEYRGERGLKGALDSLGVESVKVAVDDEGVVTDADIPGDFAHLAEIYDAGLMRPQIKVRLAKHRPFFGPGTVTLLKQIDRIGSVREACEKTGISYSKGWNMIRQAEEELGYRIVERQPGGKNGGMAYVTERGKRLLELFEQYEAQMETAAKEIYHKIFFGSDLF